jgi:hypothetical protein
MAWSRPTALTTCEHEPDGGVPRGLPGGVRALAEARDGPFYDLYVHQPWKRPTIPTIDFRIFKMDSQDVWLVVGVDGQRPDGFGVTWSLGLGVASTGFAVSAGVEITDKAGNVDEVFRLSDEASSAADAADLIQRYSTEVCAQRSWTAEGKTV